MIIKEVMTDDVRLCEPGTTLAVAARVMRDEDVGALPVGENDRLVGMITDRDIVVRGLARNLDAKTATVKEAMSDKVLYCREDQDVEEVAKNMSDEQIRRLPVVNAEKRLVGMVSLGDLSARGKSGAAEKALEGVSKPA